MARRTRRRFSRALCKCCAILDLLMTCFAQPGLRMQAGFFVSWQRHTWDMTQGLTESLEQQPGSTHSVDRYAPCHLRFMWL